MRQIIISSLLLCGLAAEATAQTARTARGTLLDVSPDSRRFLVRVPVSGGDPIERTFYIDDLTTIRAAGRTMSFGEIPAGGGVEITYDRRDGRNVARLVEISPNVPVTTQLTGPIDTLEEREQYEALQQSTLEVFQEEIEELGRASEVEGTEALARSRAWSDRLENLLADASRRLEALTGARGAAWEGARSELERVMNDLRTELAAARREITGR